MVRPSLKFLRFFKCSMALVLASALAVGLPLHYRPPLVLAAETEEEFTPEQARALVRQAVEYWRGQTSHIKASMLVHRSDWQRQSELRSWTKGTDLSLVRFVAPKKDAGNASLTIEDDMWTFSPKTNRAIKIPPSMKSQSWMGSDFSYQDLSKDDEILEEYTHRLLSRSREQGRTVYEVEALPKENAPIVWGREVLKIRDDHIILEHTFYDQDGAKVKQLQTLEVGELGGKLYPLVMRMTNLEEPSEWTEIRHTEAQFDLQIDRAIFSVGALSQRPFGGERAGGR